MQRRRSSVWKDCVTRVSDRGRIMTRAIVPRSISGDLLVFVVLGFVQFFFGLSLSNSRLGFRVVCCKVYGFRPFNLEKKNRMMILM